MGKTYTDIAARLADFRDMAKLIHMSQMVAGIKDADMAFMVLMECEVTGQTLFQWAEENHIVGSRPTMKYDAMVAAFNSLPGCRLKLIEKTPERVAIALIDAEDIQEFSLTWDELKKEAVPYNGKESEVVAALAAGQTPKLKDKYATPRSRAVMMYARLVSDAIRSTRPEVTKGKYTPEEVEDFDDTIDAVSVAPVPALRVEAKPTARVETVAKPEPVAKPKPEEKPESNGAVKTVAESKPDINTGDDAVSEAAKNSTVGKTEIELTEPCTAEQVARIKDLLGSLKKGGVDLFSNVKAKLAASGVTGGLSGMTIAEADSLRRSLENREITEWANSTVKGHTANDPS